MKIKWKYLLLALLVIVLLAVLYIGKGLYDKIHPSPRVADGNTSIIGFNHIGINVSDLDVMLPFYKQATGYEVIQKDIVNDEAMVNSLLGMDSVCYERVVLKGPNMLLELIEYSHPRDTVIDKMPPYGPGMTHTCYQSRRAESGYEKFMDAGVDILTKGGKPIDLQGLGVSYAYGYDPEGNMLELEQMSERVIAIAIGTKYAKKHPMWMTQVCLISPDINRIVEFYEMVLGIPPYRLSSYGPSAKTDSVANLKDAVMEAGWFALDKQNKKMELMQYTNPQTAQVKAPNPLNKLGYTFSLEVEDIQSEYERLKNEGVGFISPPQKSDNFWMAYAHDVDGNVFSLRQVLDPASSFSLNNWE